MKYRIEQGKGETLNREMEIRIPPENAVIPSRVATFSLQDHALLASVKHCGPPPVARIVLFATSPMPTVQDQLDTRRDDTFRAYQARIGDPDCCQQMDLQVTWLETELENLFRWTMDKGKTMPPLEVAILWEKNVQTCDFLINFVRTMEQRTHCPVTYDTLLDLRNQANDKAGLTVCPKNETMIPTSMRVVSMALRQMRSQQPKVTLEEAQQQADRVTAAGKNSPLRFQP